MLFFTVFYQRLGSDLRYSSKDFGGSVLKKWSKFPFFFGSLSVKTAADLGLLNIGVALSKLILTGKLEFLHTVLIKHIEITSSLERGF